MPVAMMTSTACIAACCPDVLLRASIFSTSINRLMTACEVASPSGHSAIALLQFYCHRVCICWQAAHKPGCVRGEPLDRVQELGRSIGQDHVKVQLWDVAGGNQYQQILGSAGKGTGLWNAAGAAQPGTCMTACMQASRPACCRHLHAAVCTRQTCRHCSFWPCLRAKLLHSASA